MCDKKHYRYEKILKSYDYSYIGCDYLQLLEQ